MVAAVIIEIGELITSLEKLITGVLSLVGTQILQVQHTMIAGGLAPTGNIILASSCQLDGLIPPS